MFVITLYAKNAQDFRMMAFSKGFLAFFAKHKPYNALTNVNLIF